MSRPIAQAACSTAYCEQAQIHHSRAQIDLNDALLGQPSLPYRALGITATVRNYTIRNAVLDTATGLLSQDGFEISETSYFPLTPTTPGVQPPPAGLVSLDDSEHIIIGCNNVHAGYQHWLTQCVPAIDWSLRQPRTRSVRLLLPALAKWQEAFLEILGYSQIPRLTVQPNTRYHLPHAEYSEFLNGTTTFRVCLSVRDTARRVLDRLPATHSPHRVVFVPCSNPYYGCISNADELADLLRHHGIFVLDNSLTVAERINLFRHANVVIGPLGQGLADVLFCQPGALLWEWMPRHHQNASFNRLAQAAEVDYWGDLFDSEIAPGATGPWAVDLAAIDLRLAEISRRLARGPRQIAGTAPPLAGQTTTQVPIDEVLLAFESLGDNCEFGLVQRHAGIEPLGLLRFAGTSLAKLVAALQSRFDGLGGIDSVTIYPGDGTGRRELMVHETSLDTRYHTSFHEGEIDVEDLRRREAKRLGFLRHKLLDDLAVGEKIWVWRELRMTDPARLQPLLDVLRRLGPNILLWVVEADANHPAGTVERLDRDFIKGHVERLAPYENATDIRLISWFEVCENAYRLCRIEPARPRPAAPPIRPRLVSPVDTPAIDAPPFDPPPADRRVASIVAPASRALSAMDFLALNQPAIQSALPMRPGSGAGWLIRLRHSLGL